AGPSTRPPCCAPRAPTSAPPSGTRGARPSLSPPPMNSLLIADRFPALAQLLNGQRLESRGDELERLGLAPLWQVEQDLQLLGRRKTAEELGRAYRDLLRNPDKFIDAMYEIRVAAMIAKLVSALELEHPVGNITPDMS